MNLPTPFELAMLAQGIRRDYPDLEPIKEAMTEWIGAHEFLEEVKAAKAKALQEARLALEKNIEGLSETERKSTLAYISAQEAHFAAMQARPKAQKEEGQF